MSWPTTNKKRYKLSKRWGTWQQCPVTNFCYSKSISAAEKRYSNTEREALGILHDLKKFHHCYFPWEVSIITGYKLSCSNLQEGCSHTVAEITMHTTQNSSIQSKNNTQTWVRSVHNRLAVNKKLKEKQR